MEKSHFFFGTLIDTIKIYLFIVTVYSMHHHAKFCTDRSNHCRDMAVFRLFKIAAVRHLGFVMHLFGSHTKSIWWSLSPSTILLELMQ